MTKFYRHDIVQDETGTKYEVASDSNGNGVDLYVINENDERELPIIEVNTIDVHLVSRSLFSRLQHLFGGK